MSTTPPPPDRDPPRLDWMQEAERIDGLLAEKAVFGQLDEEEQAELDALVDSHWSRIDSHFSGDDTPDRYDYTAATVAASTGSNDPLPESLRGRVLATASPREPSVSTDPLTNDPPMSWRMIALAVAAGLLVSLMINNLRPGPTLSQQRVALLESSDAVVQVAWAPQQDALLTEGLEGDSAYGDVVWSDATQTGYMRFRGLKPNDPAVEQYQLWVFDEARNAEHPVDGGVFDIAATDDGEAIIPINAKLPITKATLFAITVEKPGGVVVSDRSRLPLLAQR